MGGESTFISKRLSSPKAIIAIISDTDFLHKTKNKATSIIIGLKREMCKEKYKVLSLVSQTKGKKG